MAGAKNGVFAEKISPYLRKKIEEAGEPLPFLDLQYAVDPSEAVEQNGWQHYDQKGCMEASCRASGLDQLTFHELRHTYASSLLNSGVPLANVAAQLGHADTRMVERYYGHLSQSAHAEFIRKMAPVLDLSKPGKKVGGRIASSHR